MNNTPKWLNPISLNILLNAKYNNSSKGLDLSVRESLKKYIEDFYVYSIDVNNFGLTGFDDVSVKQIFKYLRKTKYNTKRKRAKRNSVKDGVGAIAFTIINGITYYDAYKVQTPFTTSGDKVIDIYLYKENENIMIDGNNEQLYSHYYINNGKVIKEKCYKSGNSYIGISSLSQYREVEAFTYSFMTELPVALLPNDEEYNSIFKNVEKLITITAKHAKNIDVEWNYDKTLLELNSVNQSGYTSEKLQEEIEDGKKRVFGNQKPRGFAEPILNFASGGGLSSQVAAKNYETFKHEVLLYTLSWASVSDGKTNKHGAEVLSNQVSPVSKIQYMLELTETFIEDFLRILFTFTTFTEELVIQDNNNWEVEVNYSDIINRIVKSAQLPDEKNKTQTPPKSVPNIEGS